MELRSRSVRLSIILLVSLLMAGTFLLTACGGGSTTTTGAPGGSGSTGSTAAGTPKYGGTLRVVAQSNGANIGWPATQATGGALVNAYYETLLRSDNKGNLTPWLAESYKVADDHKSITFTIRKGVKFTDGSDLNAAVVKWNLDQRVKTQPTWSSIQVVDPYTVRVNVKSWDSSSAATFGDSKEPALYMVSKAAYDTHGQAWITTHPVGTGPFSVTSYVTDTTAKLVKNPTYWAKAANGDKLPYLDGVEFTFTTDATTVLMMAKSGEIDMAITVSPGKQMADYRDMGWRVERSYESNEVWVPDSANADSPWSKLEVREAAEYALDRDAIAKMFGYGYMGAPYQIPPRDTTAYQANYPQARKYDPAKAKQLLTQAGYPNGFKTTLILWPGVNKDIALAEQQYLAKVGIQAEIQYTDMGKWNSFTGPVGKAHNAILEGPDPAQGPSGLGTVTFGTFLYGNSMQQPAELKQAMTAASSAAQPDVTLVRKATDLVSQNALMIPVWELGGGRVEQQYVVSDFGHRGLPALLSLETTWLNK